MNRISLAAKYLTRRKSRACLILIVFLVINIMAFIIISIRESANDALAKLDQKPLDYFYLESQYETDPKTVIAEGSSISFLSVPYVITDEVIENVTDAQPELSTEEESNTDEQEAIQVLENESSTQSVDFETKNDHVAKGTLEFDIYFQTPLSEVKGMNLLLKRD